LLVDFRLQPIHLRANPGNGTPMAGDDEGLAALHLIPPQKNSPGLPFKPQQDVIELANALQFVL